MNLLPRGAFNDPIGRPNASDREAKSPSRHVVRRTAPRGRFGSSIRPDKGDKTQRRRLSRRHLARVRVGLIHQPRTGKGRSPRRRCTAAALKRRTR